jgi:hypothetical protein
MYLKGIKLINFFTSHKTVIFILTAVRPSNLTVFIGLKSEDN